MKIEHRDRAWLVLTLLKDYGPQERKALVVADEEDTKATLSALFRSNYVKTQIDGLIGITTSGSKKLRQVNDEHNGPMPVAGKRTHVGVGLYDGKELRRTCLRPGAYDAFEMPSRMADGLHYRREIRA